ncbi:MAG: PaaI family thioesterase [Gammaproteobacteria bacterium]
MPMLEYMRRQLAGTLAPDDAAHMRHPPAIWQTLGFCLVAVGEGEAIVETNADPAKHGNQQGTIHGGFLCELADAAIGAAHSTLMREGETFATVELKINYFRPSWKTVLRAEAKPMQSGKTLTHYRATITRADGKTAAIVTSTVITLRGERAKGR